MKKIIYRITSFDRFKTEFLAKALGFVTYDTWEDPSEGPILRAIEHDEGKKRILDWLGKHSQFDLQPEHALGVLAGLRKTVHMQSWSGTPESNLMWDAYSHDGRAIRISATQDSIRRLGGVQAIGVDYRIISLKHELSQVFKRGKIHLSQVFARKAPYYKGEKEIRLITDIDLSWLEKTKLPYGAPPSAIRSSFQSIVDQGAMTSSELENTVAAWIQMACVKPVSFSHVDGFIGSVLVGPRASADFVSEVEAFCTQSGVPFDGKSRMLTYQLPKD